MGKILRHKWDGCKSQTFTGAGASGANLDISCRGKEKSYMRKSFQIRFRSRKMGIKKEKTPVNRDFLLATFLSKVMS